MKIIVLGLGNFGMALAAYLAETNNEVIATDIDMEKIDKIKDKVSHAVALDATHENAYNSLPLKHTDLAVVAIGERNGVNIKATAIIKKITNARVIARSSSSIEDTILEAMGVDQIIHPEQEYAERLTKKINLRGSIDNFEIDMDSSVSEVPVCEKLIGKTIMEADFRQKNNLNIITILRKKKFKNFIDRSADKQEVIGIPKPETEFMAGDILVVFGTNKAIEKYLEKNGLATEP
ncbi:MAG TPA: TrkA family potassium uptake protein [Flavobacteriaceae bacterium]|nr:TrkA family potassium uptake protein [Flavobacteriaceae bacterium]